VNTTAYADGDLVGGKITLTDIIPQRQGGILQSIELHDLDAQDAALILIIWDQNPSGTTFTNNSALDVADADLPNIIGLVWIGASDYEAFADNSAACVQNIGMPVKAADDSGDLYAAFLSDGATPTYTANGLSLTLNLLVDEV
jgi:hypothetical protein